MSLYYEWGARKFDPVTNEFKISQDNTLFRKVQPNPTSVFIKERYSTSLTDSVVTIPILLITTIVLYSLLRSNKYA